MLLESSFHRSERQDAFGIGCGWRIQDSQRLVASEGWDTRGVQVQQSTIGDSAEGSVLREERVKLQYLGDSKDSFKWDYHHHLVAALGYDVLTIAWMLTRKDRSTHGRTDPTLFSADARILDLCGQLRDSRNLELIAQLPEVMNSSYQIRHYAGHGFFSHAGRTDYFDEIPFGPKDQLVFLDPDNGFEPPKHPTSKHVTFDDIRRILARVSGNSAVSVFHHFRHKRFIDDFTDIRATLGSIPSTALYWRSLMFVAVSHSDSEIAKIREFNSHYRTQRAGVVTIP